MVPLKVCFPKRERERRERERGVYVWRERGGTASAQLEKKYYLILFSGGGGLSVIKY